VSVDKMATYLAAWRVTCEAESATRKDAPFLIQKDSTTTGDHESRTKKDMVCNETKYVR
jgi:hypothetical protein